MFDLIERLRCQYACGPLIDGKPEFGYLDTSGPMHVILPTSIMKEAADELERLTADVARLRAELASIRKDHAEELACMRAERDRYAADRDSLLQRSKLTGCDLPKTA